MEIRVPGVNCENLARVDQCDLIFRGAINQVGIYEISQSILFLWMLLPS